MLGCVAQNAFSVKANQKAPFRNEKQNLHARVAHDIQCSTWISTKPDSVQFHAT